MFYNFLLDSLNKMSLYSNLYQSNYLSISPFRRKGVEAMSVGQSTLLLGQGFLASHEQCKL